VSRFRLICVSATSRCGGAQRRDSGCAIKFYRTRPDLAILFELMTDFDEGQQEWRYRHVKVVERTIGAKRGTGGSPGVEFSSSRCSTGFLRICGDPAQDLIANPAARSSLLRVDIWERAKPGFQISCRCFLRAFDTARTTRTEATVFQRDRAAGRHRWCQTAATAGCAAGGATADAESFRMRRRPLRRRLAERDGKFCSIRIGAVSQQFVPISDARGRASKATTSCSMACSGAPADLIRISNRAGS